MPNLWDVIIQLIRNFAQVGPIFGAILDLVQKLLALNTVGAEVVLEPIVFTNVVNRDFRIEGRADGKLVAKRTR